MQQHALMQGSLHNEWEGKHEEAHGSKTSAVGRLKQALSMLHNRALAVLLCSKVYPACQHQPFEPNQNGQKSKACNVTAVMTALAS